ncbi:MAG: hypothetical protein JWR20_2840, partial [Marmoricola sp.]|nr:hypothetical protein [Marmoricola sp.]
MTGHPGHPGRRLLTVLLGVVLVALGTAGPSTAAAGVAASTRGDVGSRPVVVPRDRRLTETSGVVDRGTTVVLTNDSGSCACLYVVS